MPDLIEDLQLGDYVRGYLFECEACHCEAIGRVDARFCSDSCRHLARQRAREAQRAAEEQRMKGEAELAFLRRFAPDAASPADAARFISANLTGDVLREMETVSRRDIDRLAFLVWRQDFMIRKHAGPVGIDSEDFVEVKL